MAKAAEIEYTDFENKLEYLYGIRSYFIEEIEKLEGTVVNGGKSRGSLTGRQKISRMPVQHLQWSVSAFRISGRSAASCP